MTRENATLLGKSFHSENNLDEKSLEDESLTRLLAPGIKLILLKGIPGVGKTTLATKLLESVDSGTYVSSRVGIRKLSEQNPRIKELELKGKLQELNVESKKVNYEDMRLGMATDVIEKVLDAVSAKKELIVLDSWDTMTKEMDRLERLKSEKAIASIIDASRSRCMFISEEPELTTTDYLVDAIVALNYSDLHGRRLREIVWEKLRGQPISDNKQVYTLRDGQFATLPLTRTEGGGQKRRFEPIPHPARYYSTGSRDLDEFLGGGLRRGSFVLLELGDTVGNNWHHPLYTALMCNFVMNGGTCMVVPSLPTTPQMVLDVFVPYVEEELTRSNLRIISFMRTIENPSIVEVVGKPPEEAYDIQQKTARELKGPEGRTPTLWLLSMDTYETFGGSDQSAMASFIARGTASLRQYGDVIVMQAKSSTAARQFLSDNCDLHLKLEEVDGSLIMYAKRPPTNAYGVAYNFDRGYPQVRLTRIM